MARAFDTLMEEELRRRSVPGASPFDVPPPEPRRNINSIVDPSTDTFIDRFRPVSSDPAGDYQKEQRFEMQRRMQEIEKGVPVYRPGTPRFGDPTKVISQAGTGTATDALPPGFSYAEPAGGLPPGFSYADAPAAAPPQLSVPAPGAGMSQAPEDPFERAALRQRASASGARPEGAATRAIEGVVPALGREVNRLGEVAKQAVTTGDIGPKEALEAATMLSPTSVAYRTGVGVARAALTPAELAARETGVMSIPRAADAGPVKQALGRGLTAAPVGGGPLRAAAERATGELEAAGAAAAARPTGVVPTQNLAGSHVRRGLERTAREAGEEGLPRQLQTMLGRSNEDMIGTIARMAGDVKTGANINMLAQVRSAVPARDWRNVQGALIDRMGQSPATGQFDPRTWLRNYGSVSERGRNILFGREADALRVHLDAIEAVARRAPTWQQFQRRQTALGTQVGVAALAGIGTMAPLTLLGSVIPMHILSRSLAKPATAAPIAQWSRAYERVARTQGAPQAIAALTIATRNLNNTLGTDVSVDDILKGGASGQPVE